MTPELEAFTEECRAIETTLRGVGPAAWAGPGLGEWSLHELTAHLVSGAARLGEYAGEAVEGTDAVCDRVGYWCTDRSALAPAVSARARERAGAPPTAGISEAFAEAWHASAEVAANARAESIITTLRGPMRIDEYLATRVLEACVHHLDIRSALDLPAAATPGASRLTMAVLEALLGGPRPRNLGRVRFILAATGRVACDDPRLPVLC